MRKIIPSICLIVGSIIGAGFASGREISLFFAEFGWASLFFLPIAFILFYFAFKIFLTIGSKEQFENILELNKKTNSSVFFDITIVAIYVIYASAMFSCCVEVAGNTFVDVPKIVFYVLVFLLAYLVLKFGFKGLLKVNFVLIPIIVLMIVVYSVYSSFNPITNISYTIITKSPSILPFSMLMYVFSNILLSCYLITQIGAKLDEKQIKQTSFWASSIICFVILICIICLIINGSVVMDASMPFVALSLRLGEPFPLIYMLVLFFGVLTSLFGCLYTIQTCLIKKFGNKSIFICCFVAIVFSMLGFKTIVNLFYPVIGFFGFVMIMKILLAKKFHTYFSKII